MSGIVIVSRRDFLKAGIVLGGGLIIGVHLPGGTAAGMEPPRETFAPDAFIRIGTDDSVTVIVNKSEMGQGVYTALPMIVAEELEVDPATIRVEAAPVTPPYNHAEWGIQATGGSTSVRSEWDRLARAGATARMMLVAAAAETWKVKPGQCRAEKGFVLHQASGRRLSYGKLAERAARLKPPAEVQLKSPKDYSVIGRPVKRLDTPAKVDGTALFGLDVAIPGMLTAVVARPPVFGAKAMKIHHDKAEKVPGVKRVIPIDAGVAVIAESFPAAVKGRETLEIEWNEGPLAGLDSGRQRDEYAEMAKRPGAVAARRGDPDAALKQAVKRIDAVYELPYLAHAPLEPLNCVARVEPGRCDIWTGTQMQTGDRNAAAKITGLPPEKITLRTMFLGGGFGRRAVPDSHFVREAVQASKAMGKPVKVVWTRDDDIHGGWYRPTFHNELSAGLDAAGMPVAWKHRIVCQSIAIGTPFEKGMVKNGVDDTSVEGAADSPYAVPNFLCDYHMAPAGVPVLWWRSVGHSATAFVKESFIDELAHLAGKDPYQYRRQLLGKHPRLVGALDLATEKAGWGKALPEGRGRGIAVHESFGSIVAQVAEVSVGAKGEIRVHRVVCAVDCGRFVNPGIIEAQMESGIAFGLSAALHGAITFKNGRVEQSNYHDYPIIRMNEMPRVETHIVRNGEKPGGIGEPGVPPVAPAVANALFALTGARLRTLPMTPERVLAATGKT
ncbi:aldehyde oxidase and xanthine dehydrogenase molybdopterin binding [Geobacter metallireducens RCH3]|uniref:Aerobic-type carbon monoxide dehydrogenase, large subunit-like protein n=1 Tax=Geobacter metallireducens (strain ATCC 53774 / DSM 7210 / GS-15) TaxID=269799 RepID=Q39XE5_GEOMG|nr:xanthine dehydrogenase family protein molybdopterin-binding subunit [Geobacter metallireducens]ABB31079.1 aerobic-type carbon monoxide dehydrogenase, large subunit-like protein [Geobacter metallireducens GS-15]EHP86858.1 aldehyde oxidase and xanthine dehydrogenase molybdopterin binding [Geobacter metallireducens RCH3]